MSIDASLAVKRYGKELGEYSVKFRNIAAEVDLNPNDIFKHINESAFRTLYTIRTLDAERFFLLYEALAYGNIGTLFATPRTCLTGILLQFIGNTEQQEYYFKQLEENKLRSFFATTEIKFGSDASQIETTFEKNGNDILISGEKILVGNLGFSQIGAIIGRINKGPLGICAALIKPEDFERNSQAVARETLPMFGIRPAMLGKASFNHFKIPENQLIGQQIHAGERGLQALIKTFNIMRLGITGLALGHAQAVIDYLNSFKKNLSSAEEGELKSWQQELIAIRQLALKAARLNASDRLETSNISLAKVSASRLAEKASTHAIGLIGPTCLHEHPFLVKSFRDCFGYEYMDGTTNIQRKNVYQGFANGKLKID